MAFFSIAARIALAVFVLGTGACSSAEDSRLYGYEEEFAVPEPDMVPVTPDDKPGRTVDEMLNLTSPAVTVKKREEKPSEKRQVYERAGRFGSKEKISLRKGLNAPDSGVLYGSQKRRGAQEVRALEVKKQEKDEFLAVSEEEMLTSIIAPKATKLEMIEVVPASSGKKAEEPNRLLPPANASAGVREKVVVANPSFEYVREEAKKENIALSLPETEDKTAGKREEIVLLKPLPVSENKKIKVEKEEEVPPVLLKPAVVPEKIVLTPPREDIVLLKKPGSVEDDSSVEIFLDE